MVYFLSLLAMLFQGPSNSCSWGTAAQIGILEPVISESSGMAISRRIPNRSYRINDSGDTGRFFSMDLQGRNLKIVNIADFAPRDVEDMAIGSCGDSSDCLFIADIGDNNRARKDLELVVVKEARDFPTQVRADYRVRVRYPDGPHDAESIGVHPDGSVYLITKDATRSQVFRLKRDQWRASNSGVEVLEPVMVFDWRALLPNSLSAGRLATAMDIAPDGKRFLLLNYIDAIEFFFDLSSSIPPARSWKEGQHYRRIPLTTLEQQEAIAYMPDGRGFLYDSERRIASRPARIFRVNCRK